MDIKVRLRDGTARLLFRSGLTAPTRRSRGRFSIVTFHRVLPEGERRAYPYPGLVVTPQELDSFLAYFTRYFDCGSLEAQHERYFGGAPTGKPLLAITFDDAQYDNHLHARPVLARHGVKATFFVPVAAVESGEPLWHDRLGFAVLALLNEGQSGREMLMRILKEWTITGRGPGTLVQNVVQQCKDLTVKSRLGLVESLVNTSAMASTPGFARMMTFDELEDLASDGHEIGSHSMTHCMMPECNDSELAYELSESRLKLHRRLRQSIHSFCYPNGNADDRTARAVARAGYHRAVTTRWGNNAGNTDHFQLRRYDIDARRVQDSSGEFIPDLLAFRMSGFYPGMIR